MKLKSFLIGVGIVIVLWLLYVLFRGATVVSPVEAHNDVLCHQHTGNGCMQDWRDSCNNGQGWHNGACPAPTSTPTPTHRPTSTPTCTPKPTTTPEPTPTDEPEPTPEVTQAPVCTENCGTPPTFAASSTEAPKCGVGDVSKAVVNPHVYRKGDVAIVRWWNTAGDKAHIYYKQVNSKDWQYSVVVPNTGSAEIKGLGTMDISFAVMQVDSCSGGVSVNASTIVDGNTDGWTLYR